MTSQAKTRLLVAALCAAFLSACDSGSRIQTYDDASGSTTSNQPSSGGSGSSSNRKAEPNWAKLRKQVKNADAREEEALNTIKEALETWKKMDALEKAGGDFKPLLEQAKQLKQDAGDLYDLLEEDVSRVHPELFKNGFKSFQAQWNRYTKNRKFQRILMR